MSMDLYLWKAPVTDDPDEAAALLDRHIAGDAAVFSPDPGIAAVAAELDRLYPWRWLSNEETVAAMSEEEKQRYTPEALKEVRTIEGGEPWASLPFDQSDRLLALNIRWGSDNQVLDDVVRLGREHDLVIYDPQGPSVYLPDDPIEQEPIPPTTVKDVLSSLIPVTLLAALTWGAWLIPVGWISWPAVIILGFVTAAAFMVFYLLLASLLGWIDAEGQPKRS